MKQATRLQLDKSLRGALKHLDEVAKRFCGDVLSIILFGSAARGDADSDSDVDVFVLVKSGAVKNVEQGFLSSQEYRKADREVFKKYSGGLCLLVLDAETLVKYYSPLHRKLLDEGIIIYGDDIKGYIEPYLLIYEEEEEKKPVDPRELLRQIEKEHSWILEGKD